MLARDRNQTYVASSQINTIYGAGP